MRFWGICDSVVNQRFLQGVFFTRATKIRVYKNKSDILQSKNHLSEKTA